MTGTEKLSFTSDYMEGAHPAILKRLAETNMAKSAGYGLDEFSEAARDKIRTACGAPDADVYFLSGGTQANAVMIDALLRPYQGVISAQTGHINGHEAGAIEAGGHKVLAIPHVSGKVRAEDVSALIEGYLSDENRDHIVMPGMVYISQPTEYGTLYSIEELRALSAICRSHGIPLYMDGARLAYALACPKNSVALTDIAELCDAFYIGGTKCGALFGEAVVIPKRGYIPHLFTMIKQHGALLAKGRIAALQFDALFTDGLYYSIGRTAIAAADRIRTGLAEKAYELAIDSPTNQIFVILEKAAAEELLKKVDLGFWENLEGGRTVYRIATSWATREEDADRLLAVL